MAHVFISYKRDDKAFVLAMEKRMVQEGLEVWTDNQIQPREEWRTTIDAALANAFAVVVVMTSEARKSEYVTYEWSYAMGMGKRIIPIMLQLTQLHPKLEALNYLDFTVRQGEPWDRLINHLKQLQIMHSIPLPGLKSVSNNTAPPKLPQTQNSGDGLQQNTIHTSSTVNADELDRILENLSDEKPQVRLKAVRQLLMLKALSDEDKTRVLLTVIHDNDDNVLLSVIQAIGSVGNTTEISILDHLYSTNVAPIDGAARNAKNQIQSRHSKSK